MNRWTRVLTRLNSADLLLRSGSFHSQKTLTCTHIQSSSPRFSIIRSFAINSGSRRKRSRELRGKVLVPVKRRELPEELSKCVLVLTCESTAKGGSCRVYLVGTLHNKEDSAKKVTAVIRSLKPEVVFLELCSDRRRMLTSQKSKSSEFRVAFEEARACGAKVILGDRSIKITRRRAYAKMTLSHKIKWFFFSRKKRKLLWGERDDVDVFAPVNQYMSTFKESLIPMGKMFPAVLETYVHERDKYMSSKLLEVASEHSSVVAVVGMGHLHGMKKHWKQPVELTELLEVPAQKARVSAVKVITSLGVCAIISGIYFTCKI